LALKDGREMNPDLEGVGVEPFSSYFLAENGR
jgi:hypothetical protein